MSWLPAGRRAALLWVREHMRLLRYDLLIALRLLQANSRGWQATLANLVVAGLALAFWIGLRDRGSALFALVPERNYYLVFSALVSGATFLGWRRILRHRKGSLLSWDAWNPYAAGIYCVAIGSGTALGLTGLALFYRSPEIFASDKVLAGLMALLVAVSVFTYGFLASTANVQWFSRGVSLSRSWLPRLIEGRHGLAPAIAIQQIGLSRLGLSAVVGALFLTMCGISIWMNFSSRWASHDLLLMMVFLSAALPILIASRGDFATAKLCQAYGYSRRRLILAFGAPPLLMAAVSAAVLLALHPASIQFFPIFALVLVIAMLNVAALILSYYRYPTKTAAMLSLQKWLWGIGLIGVVFPPAALVVLAAWIWHLTRPIVATELQRT